MTRRSLTLVAMVAFFVGLLAPGAYAASYKTSWHKIFGHSTSCALGRGSINDTTHKSGASTANRKGCSAGNAAVTVPPAYIYASTRIHRLGPGAGYWCSYDTGGWNKTVTADVTFTSPLVASAYCPRVGGEYVGISGHIRAKAAGGTESIVLDSPIVIFE